ncbi:MULTISPECIES: hypothetical protein [unclassified Arthrobacter]|uniref:hypothetical protein n=1 Tax=unclassified Arthrobacter TaxID=235627 RepID=UPI001C85CB66|nr:hypothetical protein [Arthrobacter sp. MAHUQ-56]MBX7442318.1 hypothetical protein [Arthrobacter sp. MAHUQ-56]
MDKTLPVRHGLGKATGASVAAAAAVVVASGVGLGAGVGRYAQSQSVLVSQGADAANLIVVVLVLAALWFARRGSLTALLLWPGGLFYLAYAYMPYLIGAPFTPLLFDDAVVFLAAAFGLASLSTAIDGTALRERFSGAPARAVGAFLTVIGVLAYAGLVVTAVSAFGSSATEAAWRGHWVADWILGTPVLILAGVLLWARRPFGYTAAPGLLLVSALGGVVFAVSAVLDNLTGGIRTDLSVVVVHLVIGAASLAVLIWFLATGRRAERRDPKGHLRRGAAAGTT